MAGELQAIRGATRESSPPREAPVAKRRWTRLSAEVRTEVVARYETGETSIELAAAYGVSKTTILGVLRANNVVVRRQSLTPEQVAEATRLYESGLSLSQLAERMSLKQDTIRLAMKRSDVELRPPTGG